MKLFEPFVLNKTTLRNRIIMPGMDTNFGDEEGNIYDKLIQYYELRAKGGVGLIIVEGAYFDKRGSGTANMLSIDSNKRIARFKQLVDAIEKHGSHALLQIYHAGAQASSYMIGLQAVAPSAVPFEMAGETPIPLTVKQLKKIVKGYSEACLRAKKAGFVGVEIHAGHGYLLNQFLSLRTNKRQDMYGGQTFENRTRVLVEVLHEVRKKCGPDFIIGFRLNGSDYIKEGLDVEDVVQITQILEKESADIFNITGGVFDSPRFPVVPYMNYPKGCFVENASIIKKSLKKVPVAVVGRINTPEYAESVLQEGKVDLLSIGRSLIADHSFPNKIKEKKTDSIRKCIGCNACLNQIMTEQQIECAVNANLIGTDEDIKQTTNARKIVIVGAGPAGLELARIATIRGHKVVLIDKEKEIGGSLNLAKVAPSKKEVQNLIDYYNFVLKEHNIETQLETLFSRQMVDEIGADIVVLATGIREKIPEIKGWKNDHFLSFSDVLLRGKIPQGKNIAILGGDMIGVEVAEYLVSKGKHLTIITSKKRLGTDMYSLVAREIIVDIEDNEKIEVLTETMVTEIVDGFIICESKGEDKKIKYDGLVHTSAQTFCEIENELEDFEGIVFKIGDCKEIKPRKVLDAVKDGYNLGLIIESPEAEELFSDAADLESDDIRVIIKNKIKQGAFTNNDIPTYLDMLVTICNGNATIQKKNKKAQLGFFIVIGDEKRYFIRIDKGTFSAGEGIVEEPDVTIEMDPSIASGIFAGTINAASAYMAKELKFKGSMRLGLKFRSMTDIVRSELDKL
ncbi:MAG: FAD-dependent oxidoreductase [Candidatus Heimdallarchaeota archaeon]|nr:FAD-dependent oxidoreductase [Candidatus Heimdallarchaeota archaeon]